MVIPTIFAVLLRYGVYQHLNVINRFTNKLLRGHQQDESPAIINRLNQRLQENQTDLEQINTAVIIDGLYGQEKIQITRKKLQL